MYSLLAILYVIHAVNCALLLWTPKPVLLPALKPFTNEDYDKLLNDLDYPPIVAFKASSLKEAAQLQKVLDNNNTVYLLKAGIDISDDVEIEEITEGAIENPTITNKANLVILILDETLQRTKRNADNITNEEVVEEQFVPVSEPPITGSVLYTYIMDKNEVMVYSSKPLMLYIDDATIYLGKAAATYIDIRESFTRLIARVPTVNNRIIFIRFIFSMVSGYWYLNTIEVQVNSVRYNLALISNNITAPNHMSYHCEDETIFSDLKTNISLYLYDLQAQPDTTNHRFSDAYNCIPFTTAPILSGLFVTSIMCIGLAIGLMALASIKTMDKFDNSRSKQLSITLFD